MRGADRDMLRTGSRGPRPSPHWWWTMTPLSSLVRGMPRAFQWWHAKR